MELRRAVIVDAARTANARADTGGLRNVRADVLMAELVRRLLDRNPDVAGEEIEDLVLGCAFPEAEQGMNLGRRVALLADLPLSVAGVTVNRFCAASAEALHMAARAVMTGDGDVFVVAGVESMTHIPLGGFHPELALAPELLAQQRRCTLPQTAQHVHERCHVSRAEMDALAVRSHRRAARAQREGAFAAEIVPVTVPAADGDPEHIFQTDDCVRPETTLETLAKLPPLAGIATTTGAPIVVTAGNAAPRADGAAALLVMEERLARERGYTDVARVAGTGVAGVHPHLIGLGPVPASRKALARAGRRLDEVDRVELSEAFAAHAVVAERELGLDPAIVNVHGGSLSLGHPLGQVGARLLVTLFHELRRRDLRVGLTALCISGGQGLATVLERARGDSRRARRARSARP